MLFFYLFFKLISSSSLVVIDFWKIEFYLVFKIDFTFFCHN